MVSNKYKIKAKVWLYKRTTKWYLVSIPKKESEEIKERFEFLKRGWGSLKVAVSIGNTKWSTSIFPDKKLGVYVLPLKTEVRKKEKIKNNDIIIFSMEILV